MFRIKRILGHGKRTNRDTGAGTSTSTSHHRLLHVDSQATLVEKYRSSPFHPNSGRLPPELIAHIAGFMGEECAADLLNFICCVRDHSSFNVVGSGVHE
jgi:hypothetical protein